MDDYAGRVLADRYRLPLPPSDEYELTESRAFDTHSGQEVMVRQIPLPEIVEAEVLDAEGLPDGFTARSGRDHRGRAPRTSAARTATRRPADPVVRRALEAAQAAARVPDHPRLDQVFDVFAEGGSLWIVSELVPARPLSALLAEKPLTPYRAAEVASDVLMALRVLHAHGWVHRNITARTVLVCDDGRVVLTGLAAGAAEEALCGYDPVPAEDGQDGFGHRVPAPGAPSPSGDGGGHGSGTGTPGAEGPAGPGGARAALSGGSAVPPGGLRVESTGTADPDAARRAAIEAREAGGLPGLPGLPGRPEAQAPAPGTPAALTRDTPTGGDIRAARAGAIAAYRAGARAAARVQEAQQSGRAALPGPGAPVTPYALGGGPALPGRPVTGDVRAGREEAPAPPPPGQIVDPYGVRGRSHGTGTPQPGTAHPASVPRQQHPGAAVARNGAPDPAAHPAHAAQQGAAQGQAQAGARTGQAGPQAESGPSPVPLQKDAGWDQVAAPTTRGPATALAAERARQARMALVGPVTERWAPEQAGPVHENWQLAPPIGPATDLWALGALLFRAVQGHAPYPEESTAELVQMVCAEPPAFAEECGPLRPVVESLLRQDPTERPDFEELRGWLRSLVRSAPEPDAGADVVAAPPLDMGRLPVVRRRGELVRKRRAGLPASHGRHKRARADAPSPGRLGRRLLLIVLLLVAGAIGYAMLFMPRAGETDRGAGAADRTSAQRTPPAPAAPAPSADGGENTSASSPPATPKGGTSESVAPQGSRPGVAAGFTLRSDPAGFTVAVANGWSHTPRNGRGQVVFSHGNFDLIVVPGRDRASQYGDDPMAYQREDEPELQPYRDSTWASASGLRTTRVGGRTMAEGQFTWTDSSGRELYVRNLALLVDGRYHVVQVRGPEAERDEVSRLFEQARDTYRVTD